MNIEDIVTNLRLQKHPEGGFYREIYRCDRSVSVKETAANPIGIRSLSTSIYYLLRSEDISRLHRLRSDELWYFHSGSALSVFTIDFGGILQEHVLGARLEEGEQPQLVVPAGCIFGARLRTPDSFTLIGCMVSPGFDFLDFELMSRESLLRSYPQHHKIIHELT